MCNFDIFTFFQARLWEYPFYYSGLKFSNTDILQSCDSVPDEIQTVLCPGHWTLAVGINQTSLLE